MKLLSSMILCNGITLNIISLNKIYKTVNFSAQILSINEMTLYLIKMIVYIGYIHSEVFQALYHYYLC